MKMTADRNIAILVTKLEVVVSVVIVVIADVQSPLVAVIVAINTTVRS